MRVFEIVGCSATTIPEASTPAAVRIAVSWRISLSSPQKPAWVTLTPRPTRFMATLAAPPGELVVRTERSTGTGASGEMRSTSPQMERSSMTSPITRMRKAANPLSISSRSLDCSFKSISSSSQINSTYCDWPILRRARHNTYGDRVTQIQCYQGPADTNPASQHQVGPLYPVAGRSLPAALDRRHLRSEGGWVGDIYHYGLRVCWPGHALPLGIPAPDVAAAQPVDRHLPLHRRHADPAVVAHGWLSQLSVRRPICHLRGHLRFAFRVATS